MTARTRDNNAKISTAAHPHAQNPTLSDLIEPNRSQFSRLWTPINFAPPSSSAREVITRRSDTADASLYQEGSHA